MELNRHLPGETPLEDHSGLIPKHVKTVRQLSVVEVQNTAEAITKYLSRRPTKRMSPFTARWMLRLHKQMFGKVWVWAGEVRTTDGLNVGVRAYRVRTDTEKLAQDVAYWEQYGGDATEQAARLHHQATVIHPFLNGNGRWARLLAQIWQYRKLDVYTEWREAEIWRGVTRLRRTYLDALKSADAGDLTPLAELQRRFTPGLDADM